MRRLPSTLLCVLQGIVTVALPALADGHDLHDHAQQTRGRMRDELRDAAPEKGQEMRRHWTQRREGLWRLRDRYRSAGPIQRLEIQRQVRRRLAGMPARDRAIVRQRLEQHLRPIPREEMRSLRDDFGRLSPGEAHSIREQVHELPPEERQEVLRRLRQICRVLVMIARCHSRGIMSARHLDRCHHPHRAR